jgi:hypothetical protein
MYPILSPSFFPHAHGMWPIDGFITTGKFITVVRCTFTVRCFTQRILCRARLHGKEGNHGKTN